MSDIHAPPPKFKRGVTDPVLDFRLEHACQSLHNLGPRALCEFIKEVEGRSPDVREFLRERLAIYNSLDATHIEILTNSGGFPPLPIYRVPEG